MNCDQAREKLIDLAYDELPPAERGGVLEHVNACQTCRRELGELRLGRMAMARHRSGEPALARLTGLTDEPPAARSGRHAARSGADRRRGRPVFWGWLPVAAGAAAVLLVTVGILVLQEKALVPAFGQDIEIKRLNVSLTIMSQPADWSGYDDFQGYTPQQEAQAVYQAVQGRRPYGSWGGLALVRDQRVVRNLPKGASEVRFTDVPSGILPDSVRLRSLDRPDGMTILEQNYQYDLASAGAVLRRYIDQPVGVTFKDGKTAAGDLLSFDGGTLVIRPKGQGPVNVARREIQAVTFARLPQGLLSRPTLVWQLANNAAAQQQFEVAYMTGGLSWRADYLVKVRPAAEPPPAAAAKDAPAGNAPFPDIIDTGELVGYATIANRSGVTYEDAQLKLMAGDLHLVQPELQQPMKPTTQTGGGTWDWKDGGFEEKSFFEYHLYTLGRPTTLRNAEVKQIELVTGSGIKLRRGYVFDPNINPTAAKYYSEFVNSEANGLGKPLPKGVVRLYAPDPEGRQAFISQMTIDHTPADEKVRLYWGNNFNTDGFAFDIACSARPGGGGRDGDTYERSWQYQLRNRKNIGVNITVVARVPATTISAECEYPWHVKQVGLVEIEVPVPANSAVNCFFTYRYGGSYGGGLKSPHDK